LSLQSRRLEEAAIVLAEELVASKSPPWSLAGPGPNGPALDDSDDALVVIVHDAARPSSTTP
jgi:hypothetical protein